MRGKTDVFLKGRQISIAYFVTSMNARSMHQNQSISMVTFCKCLFSFIHKFLIYLTAPLQAVIGGYYISGGHLTVKCLCSSQGPRFVVVSILAAAKNSLKNTVGRKLVKLESRKKFSLFRIHTELFFFVHRDFFLSFVEFFSGVVPIQLSEIDVQHLLGYVGFQIFFFG